MSKFMEVYTIDNINIWNIDFCQEGAFSDIISKIQNVLKSIWNAVKTIVSKIFSTIFKYIKKLIDAVKNFFKKKASSTNSDKNIEISNTFKQDVEKGSVIHIRDELTTICHEDRSFSTGKFDAYLDYAKKANISGLFDTFDGEDFKPKNEWDKDYWSYITASLMDNFCNERIRHLKEVGKHVYGKSATTEASESIDDDKVYVPFYRLYELLAPAEDTVNVVVGMTSKFFVNQTMYTKKIELSDKILSLFNGGKDGSIDNQGNIKQITASEKVKMVYSMNDSERGYKLMTASDILASMNSDNMTKLNAKFVIKHKILSSKIEIAYNTLQDKDKSLNDFVSNKLITLYRYENAAQYKLNFNYNINVVKSMAKAIIEDMNAIMKLFSDTYSAVMHLCLERIKRI